MRSSSYRPWACLAAGVVSINDCLSSLGEPSAPYGGFKQSGIGRSHGLAGLREMAQTRYVVCFSISQAGDIETASR